MNRIKLTSLTSNSVIVYAALVILLPIATLSILGLAYLASNELLIAVLLGWLVITSIGYVAFVVMPARKRAKQASSPQSTSHDDTATDVTLPSQLSPRIDWTEQDKAVWNNGCESIESLLATELPWNSLPDHSLKQLSQVSAHYAGATSQSTPEDALTYRFTLPEALLVLSITAHRYREFVLTHIPYSEQVNVSTLLSVYEQKNTLRSGYTWVNSARRIFRLSNPLAAAVGEIKDQFTNKLFNHLSHNVQTDLKRLLLQEVLQVAIDLYSGKLKTSATELSDYRSAAFGEDQNQPPEAKEPLRIVLLGQSSAGKSSLINALADSLQTEIDTLPTTAQTQSHAIELAHGSFIHLIDTVGLNNTPEQLAALSAIAMDADLIIFVAKATQSARQPDQQLYEQLITAFNAKPERRTPPMMLVLSHVDQLSPRAEWSPPYDLEATQGKGAQISQALTSCIEHIGLPSDVPAIPVCLQPEKQHYNTDAVLSQVMALQDTATLAQWNRRRIERGEQAITWNTRWSQVKKLGRVMGKVKFL